MRAAGGEGEGNLANVVLVEDDTTVEDRKRRQLLVRGRVHRLVWCKTFQEVSTMNVE